MRSRILPVNMFASIHGSEFSKDFFYSSRETFSEHYIPAICWELKWCSIEIHFFQQFQQTNCQCVHRPRGKPLKIARKKQKSNHYLIHEQWLAFWWNCHPDGENLQKALFGSFFAQERTIGHVPTVEKSASSMARKIEYHRICDQTLLPNIVLIRFCF